MTNSKGKTNNSTENKWGKKINSATQFIKTSALEDGQSIEGTVTAFKESTIPGSGKKVTNIVMRLPNGETRTVAPSGTVAYDLRDGIFELGKTYKITKEGTKKVKGMDTGVFGIYPLAAEEKQDDSI